MRCMTISMIAALAIAPASAMAGQAHGQAHSPSPSGSNQQNLAYSQCIDQHVAKERARGKTADEAKGIAIANCAKPKANSNPLPAKLPAPAPSTGGSQKFVSSGDPFLDCLNRSSAASQQMGLSVTETIKARDRDCESFMKGASQ